MIYVTRILHATLPSNQHAQQKIEGQKINQRIETQKKLPCHTAFNLIIKWKEDFEQTERPRQSIQLSYTSYEKK